MWHPASSRSTWLHADRVIDVLDEVDRAAGDGVAAGIVDFAPEVNVVHTGGERCQHHIDPSALPPGAGGMSPQGSCTRRTGRRCSAAVYRRTRATAAGTWCSVRTARSPMRRRLWPTGRRQRCRRFPLRRRSLADQRSRSRSGNPGCRTRHSPAGKTRRSRRERRTFDIRYPPPLFLGMWWTWADTSRRETTHCHFDRRRKQPALARREFWRQKTPD